MVDEFLNLMERRAAGHYEHSYKPREPVESNVPKSPRGDFWNSPKMGPDGRVLRLKRVGSTTSGCTSGWRTILVREVRSKTELRECLAWTADVRNMLPAIENSDLYFIAPEFSLSPSHGMLIESDERICRKIVRRTGESLDELLDRTFLGDLGQLTSSRAEGDPIRRALQSLTAEQQWLSDEIIEKWLILLEEQSSHNLLEALIESVPTDV